MTDRIFDLAGRALISTPLRATIIGTVALWIGWRWLGWWILIAILGAAVLELVGYPGRLRWR